jgi:hypothetical protein
LVTYAAPAAMCFFIGGGFETTRSHGIPKALIVLYVVFGNADVTVQVIKAQWTNCSGRVNIVQQS